jgi:hypothetical protein
LPACVLEPLHHTEYAREGCQFYHDDQREFLLMPAGLRADIPGVLVSAPGLLGPCVALTKKSYDPALFNGFREVAQFEEEAADKVGELKIMLKQFCLRDFPNDPIAPLIDHFSKSKTMLMQQFYPRKVRHDSTVPLADHLPQSNSDDDINALDDYRLRQLRKSSDGGAVGFCRNLEEAKKNWADAKACSFSAEKNSAREKFMELYCTVKQHFERLQCVSPEAVLAAQRNQLLAVIDQVTGGDEAQFLEFTR